MTLKLSDKLLIRLGVYADKKGMTSFEEVIQHLLDNAQGSKLPDEVPGLWETPRRDNQKTDSEGLPRGFVTEFVSLYGPPPKVSYFASNGGVITATAFKAELLQTKLAKVILVYEGKKPKEEKIWRANRFSEDSNLKINLSTGYLRNWRQKRIKELHLHILRPDFS